MDQKIELPGDVALPSTADDIKALVSFEKGNFKYEVPNTKQILMLENSMIKTPSLRSPHGTALLCFLHCTFEDSILFRISDFVFRTLAATILLRTVAPARISLPPQSGR